MEAAGDAAAVKFLGQADKWRGTLKRNATSVNPWNNVENKTMRRKRRSVYARAVVERARLRKADCALCTYAPDCPRFPLFFFLVAVFLSRRA